MKQILSLKLGQQLTMTPQLQQAIRLLQLSALDLRQEIQETVETNPMLELDEDSAESSLTSLDTQDPDELPATTNPDADDAPTVSSELEQPMPEELPVDSSWDDVYEPPTAATPSSGSGDGESNWDIDSNNSAEQSLQDHLRWQLNLTHIGELDRVIAFTIIDACNPDGMLTMSVDAITESFDADLEIERDQVVAVLKLLQQFDPTGICAQDLSDCLRIQLQALPETTRWRDQAIHLVTEHLDLLAAKDFATLKRRTRLTESDLAKVADLIQSLNPRPGSAITDEQLDYITPDVYVRKENDRWVVELNAEATPQIKVNDVYAGFIKRADNSADNVYLKDSLAEARWFIKSVQSRHETLLKVATKIVEHQRGFLEYGEEAMKPLVLHDIAEAVEMHESTISRVTSRKYMHTPRGIFELKYFFSSHVATNTGGEVSSTAIRALIKKLTADENPRKPLSDNKITAILAGQNIKVARRTVAKYRESMMIPPSNERKRLV
jgi:RNA polymerase sigma-54 factor